jgi:AhpD family alkylhydroperoxidase
MEHHPQNGVCDHAIKELCRVYISRTVKCEYCGNQRTEKARAFGLVEERHDDLLNFENSERYDDREKATLAYAEARARTTGAAARPACVGSLTHSTAPSSERRLAADGSSPADRRYERARWRSNWLADEVADAVGEATV